MTFRMPSWPDHEACTVEVLLVPGCAGAELTLTRIQEATESAGVDANLRVRLIEHEQAAADLGFVGSPTVRVDGRDLEDVTGRPVALASRVYADGARVERAPPADWIRRALAGAGRRRTSR